MPGIKPIIGYNSLNKTEIKIDSKLLITYNTIEPVVLKLNLIATHH